MTRTNSSIHHGSKMRDGNHVALFLQPCAAAVPSEHIGVSF